MSPAQKPTRVAVKVGARSHDVVIGTGLLPLLGGFIAALKPTSTLVITDSNIGPLHADALARAVKVDALLTVPAGEASKGIQQLGELYDRAFATGKLDRRTLIVALGGGVVGDLAGFAAATLLRGVKCVQVPTSLLAMVDSSVGGKTAINHATGKNLIGAFHQPSAVFCDMDYLKTLGQREYNSALAEVVKTGLLGGESLLVRIERDSYDLRARDHMALTTTITECVRYKAAVVAADEHETTGARALLNLGHSVAHVLETVFPARYLHGEAVAIGLGAALRLSAARCGLPATVATRVRALLQTFRLPVDVPADLKEKQLLAALAADKKRDADVVNFVVLSDIGAATSLPCKLDAALAATLLGDARA